MNKYSFFQQLLYFFGYLCKKISNFIKTVTYFLRIVIEIRNNDLLKMLSKWSFCPSEALSKWCSCPNDAYSKNRRNGKRKKLRFSPNLPRAYWLERGGEVRSFSSRDNSSVTRITPQESLDLFLSEKIKLLKIVSQKKE